MDPRAQVLIADDEPAIRTMLTEILTHAGYACSTAESGPAALAALDGGAIDVLIADIRMPGNSDLGLLKEIQQRYAGLPVILVTGHPTVDTAAAALQLPVTAYLIKPIDTSTLLEQVAKAVAQRRLTRAMEQTQTRCEKLVSELHNVRAVLAASPRQSHAGALTVYLAGVLGHVFELVEAAEAVAGTPASASPDPADANAEAQELLAEARGVLEKTKASFKSKDLGALRKKIEGYLKSS